jgi:chromate reductase
MATTLNVLGLCGSLRKASYNAAALRTAQALAPEGMTIVRGEIGDFPLYNEDVREQGFPPAVERLRQQIRDADALLIVTPEYNYSIPGVLKNAIDWASRPPEQPFAGKPMAIMGASIATTGTARALYHLRQAFVVLNALILNQPEVMIATAHQRFDADGNLTDETTRKFIGRQLEALRDWTLRLRANG